ncbi:phosphoserine phosphatase SerB [Arsukibacterium sp.]|uniref:phosphoserine phosphatase SerB n=1 Tax=Arsukibacterium sp. TaxID=1977258 RepID=UPI002FD9CDC0
MAFIYQCDPALTAQYSPAQLMALRPVWYLRCYQQQLQLACDKPLAELTALVDDLPVVTPSKASIRLFAAIPDWSQLQQLFSMLPLLHNWVVVRRYKPHAELAAGWLIELPQALDDIAQHQLKTLAASFSGELVYLDAAPSLTEPGLLVMDMDSTAIQIECIDEIAKLAGVGEQVTAVTARAMNGELDFAQSLIQRVATLAGAPESVLQQVLSALPLMSGLPQLVQHLQDHQWQVAIASGGFTYFTEALKQQLALTATFANQLQIIDGKLTGKVLGEIVDANTKASVVQQLASQYKIKPEQTVAIGDGANDLPMLAKATLGVAFHAKPKVQGAAKAAIRQGSLLQLLYLLDEA